MDDKRRRMALQDELHELLEGHLPEDGNIEITEGVLAFRRSQQSDFLHGQSRLAFCTIVQGAKQLMIGDTVYRYDADHYLVTAAELPTISKIIEASTARPYLAVTVDLDPELVRSVLISALVLHPAGDEEERALHVTPMNAVILDPIVRLVRIASNPEDASFLTPMIKREIVYRLLNNDHGPRLARIAGLNPTSQRVASAVERIRTDLDSPLRIPALASELGMSTSSFHDHFKRATGLTPLQFQKHLRLREARRLLLSEDIDVAGAGYRVGYRDASHFNRDYKRMFGETPTQDIQHLRTAGVLATESN